MRFDDVEKHVANLEKQTLEKYRVFQQNCQVLFLKI